MKQFSQKTRHTIMLADMGAKPSLSEDHGISFMSPDDLVIFSPGISTAGFAEVRMARAHPKRKVFATTIDKIGLLLVQEIIDKLGLYKQIETRREDLREEIPYPDDFFDYIYARLVLHYLSAQDLDRALTHFFRILKPNGRLFVVVQSVKNIPDSKVILFDNRSKLTSVPRYDDHGNISDWKTRYFHTTKSIRKHIERAGFQIRQVKEYQEQLYKDFMRRDISPIRDYIIEVLSVKELI